MSMQGMDERWDRIMCNRIILLLGLGLAALGSLAGSVFFSLILYRTNNAQAVERATYFAHTWLVTFGFLGGAWVWLLIKTFFYRSSGEEITYV